MTIEFPNSLGKNYVTDTLKCLGPIFTDTPNEVVLNLSPVRWIEPVGLVAITAAIRWLKINNPKSKIRIVPSAYIQSYFDRMDFMKDLMDERPTLSTKKVNQGLVEIESMNCMGGHAEEEIEEKSTSLSTFLVQTTQDADIRSNIRYCLSEFFNNVASHSDSSFGCYYCGQRWPSRSTIQVAIADCGIGIKESLNRSGNCGAIKTDHEAIKTALKPEVSGYNPAFYSSGYEHAGYGLTASKETITRNVGEIMIASGSGLYSESPDNGEEFSTMEGYWQGTLIVLELSVSNYIHGYGDILDNLKKGGSSDVEPELVDKMFR